MASHSAQYSIGSVNLANSSVSVSVMRLEAPFNRASAITTGTSTTSGKTWHPAAATKTEKGFMTQPVAHPEGTVVFVMSRMTRRGRSVGDGVVFLLLSNNAPMVRVNAVLPTQPGVTILGEQFTAFLGRAHILDERDLDVMGFRIPSGWRQQYMSQEEVDELFCVSEVVKGAPKPQFMAATQENGEVKIVAVGRKPVRGLRRRA